MSISSFIVRKTWAKNDAKRDAGLVIADGTGGRQEVGGTFHPGPGEQRRHLVREHAGGIEMHALEPFTGRVQLGDGLRDALDPRLRGTR